MACLDEAAARSAMKSESNNPLIESREAADSNFYLLAIGVVAALGGFLFGYDTAVISGAIGYLESYFQLDSAGKGWAASSALVGCVVGAAIAGHLGDRLGRKPTLILCGFLYAISAIGSGLPRSLTELAIARIVGGMAIGATSVIGPLYLAEISPARIRGAMVSLNQLGIVVGIVAAFFINYLIQQSGTESWNRDFGWRWMFAIEAAPALVFCSLLLLVPESPRWLAKQGQMKDAELILARLSSAHAARRQMQEIESSLREEKGGFGELLNPGLRKALVLGVGLAVFQQATGINAIMYYAPEVFKAAGAATEVAFLQTVSVGAVNLIFTLLAMAMIDRFGRKRLMVGGAIAQAICLTAIWWSFRSAAPGAAVLAWILLYVAAFACSFGPVVWVVIAEIFPIRIRGRAMSVATLTLWVTCYVISQTFPMMIDRIGAANSFLTYAIVSVLSIGFIVCLQPETKGRSLEEIQHAWLGRDMSSASSSISIQIGDRES